MKDIILYDCASIPMDWAEDMAKRWTEISALHVNDDVRTEVHAFPVQQESLMRFRDGVCEMLSSECVKFHATPKDEDNSVMIGRVLHEMLTKSDDLYMVTVVTSSDTIVSLVRYIAAQDNDYFNCAVDVIKVSLTCRDRYVCSGKVIRIASPKES